MMDFQKDRNNFDTSNDQQADSNAKETSYATENEDTSEFQSSPDGQNQEYLTTSVQNSNIKRSTMILCSVFAVGAASIFFMIKEGTPQSAKAATAAGAVSQIDIAIAKLSGIKAEIFDRIDGIATKFEDFSNFQQVPVDKLRINPFKLQIGSIHSNNPERFASYSGSFTLDSIMKSEKDSFCMIDDKILFIGDTISGYKVVEIDTNFVNLDNGYEIKTLKINMP